MMIIKVFVVTSFSTISDAVKFQHADTQIVYLDILFVVIFFFLEWLVPNKQKLKYIHK